MQSIQKNIKNSNLLLEVNNLNVFFDTADGKIQAVKDVNLFINKGECLGIVGESGSGKTQTFFSITGLLSSNGYCNGSAIFKDFDLISASEDKKREYLGKSIGFIFQDPMTSLTPHMKIGEQLSEIATFHDNLSKSEALKRALNVLDIVKLPKSRNLIKNNENYDLIGRYNYSDNVYVSLQAPTEEVINNLSVGVGYSLPVWNGICVEPNYTMNVSADDTGERAGSFNLGISFKF